MIHVDEDGHRLPPCHAAGCDRRAVAAAHTDRVIDITRLAVTEDDGRVVLCLPHFEELVGHRIRR